MNKTLNEFKTQQYSALEILQKLETFLEKGEYLGVEIDASIKFKLHNAINEIGITKLKVALIGGFSEGKTSIAAAWMEKLEKNSMKIIHQESSDEVKIYEVGNDIELVDTPGLFGFKEKYNADTKSIEKYKEITKKYVSEAHLILYVMNSVNPIKESHKDDLNWLFRTLKLLPRTIFVLSRFDEVADVEDEKAYKDNYEIKKNNVCSRLKELIALNEQEFSALSIVAVAANPFDMGLDHWLSNLDQFKELSHISLLQNATSEKIKQNGGISAIANETKKSIIQDVLTKQLPISKERNKTLEKEIKTLQESSHNIQRSLNSFRPKINGIRISLREFIVDYFSDLILQAKNIRLETAARFIEKEIGSEGINLNAKLQNEFERQIGTLTSELNNVEINFNAEIEDYNNSMMTYGKQGMKYVIKNNLINNGTILATRDGAVAVAKFVGLDIAKYLKFKPWGAVNAAKGVNATLAVVGLGLELWDSYQKAEKERQFNEAISDMIENFEKQKKELLELVNSDNFASQFFPTYIELHDNSFAIQNKLIEMDEKKKSFDEWVQMGEIINAEIVDM